MAHDGELARGPLGIPLEQRLEISSGTGDRQAFDLRGGLRQFAFALSHPGTVTLGIGNLSCQRSAAARPAIHSSARIAGSREAEWHTRLADELKEHLSSYGRKTRNISPDAVVNYRVSFFPSEGTIKKKSIIIMSAIALAAISGAYYHSFRASREYLELDYVMSPSLDLLDTTAVVHNVTQVLKYGERLEVLQKGERWAKVRTGNGIEGWVTTRELMPAKVYEGGEKLVQELKDRQVQAAGHTVLAANVHLEPHRGAADLGILTQGQNLEIYDRRMVAKGSAGSQTKEPASHAATGDAWYLVQADSRAGWVLGRLITLDIPQGISPYAANFNMVAWFVLNTVQDGDASVPQYLAADREGSLEFDFTHIRVFTWSRRYHHYVTSFVKSGLSGNFPIRVEHVDNVPYIRLRLMDRKGNRFQSVYGLFDTIVRPVGTLEGWESTAMPGRQGRK